jgi:creatinine amidohydrolase/Fe(II)-dependent formamide hydrolase-like protein/GNAT superfamily N-acetyltransferase
MKTDAVAATDAGAENRDHLAELLVIDRLEIGPVRLEKKRLVAPYRLLAAGRTDTFELIYSFKDPVFDPEEAASRNLAAMMAAQVALNYGLFCREMVFHGPYDTLDRRFLRTMAENTAREIYVKKFIEPNPFLVGAAARLPVVKRKSYLQARLIFSDRRRSPRAVWRPWQTDRARCAILSSGGKDSLLSFGLMQEIAGARGDAVHPLFVNESGRHWFTALNAYRHFRDRVPNTGRVWVNSDRLFAWMLRHLPFIRADFADVRADEYPVRLWTVAVFLFGVLPLMRRRGIGRLLIGDEFDTTRRTRTQGIPHYDGLFDQSIYFDQTLSAYFLQKGWMISQFSILRPLSEMLIETILARRYPELLPCQMSCHATSKREERVVPCGRCEKCRRIVGMLTAIGIDPGICGYEAGQIRSCLEQVLARGVHQEGPAAAHLAYRLVADGHLTPAADHRSEPHPEVMHLRFDPAGAPLTAVPVDLRVPLLAIFQEYAEGALERRGRRWLACDPLAHPDLRRPFAHEMETVPLTAETDDRSAPNDRYLWSEMCWPDVEAGLAHMDLALLPVGAVEQHGPHLPLDTDAFDADYLARRVAEACLPPRPLVLPLLSYGVSYHHSDFKGTLSISNTTLSQMVYEIGMGVAANGIRKLVIINGHGGNAPALNYAAQMINRDARIFVCVDSGETSDVDIDRLAVTPNDVHAGEIETSTSLATRPHLVRMDRATSEIPSFSNRYLDFSSKRGVSWYAYTHKISASGVMGDPAQASAAKGRQMWDVMVAHLVAMVEDLKQMSLDEIHHRRY